MAKLKHCPWLIPAILLSMVSAGRPDSGQDRGGVLVSMEPGFPTGDGTWVLPFTVWHDKGSWELGASNPVVQRDGRTLTIRETIAFPFRGGGQATALVVVLDIPPLDSKVIVEWAGVLAKMLDQKATPGVLASVAGCGPGAQGISLPGKSAKSRTAMAELLGAKHQGRLWDRVLDGITILGEPGLPGRRVLLLVSNGREEIPSVHVLASCVDAALRTRVAIYVLYLAGGVEAEADEARLKELARRTGGRTLNDGNGSEHGLPQILARIGAARAFRIEADTDQLPVRVHLGWNGETGPQAVGVIAHRHSFRKPGLGRWYFMGFALLAVIGAGFLVWRQRTIMIGDLLVRTKNGVRRLPIPRHGVTIGRDQDNTMVLPNPMVSSHHAVIRVKDGDIILTDLHSSRGTTVNGESVGTRKLDSGDRILIGGAVELVFRGNAEGGDPASGSEREKSFD